MTLFWALELLNPYPVDFGFFPLAPPNPICMMKQLVDSQGKWIIKGVLLYFFLVKYVIQSPTSEGN